MPDLYIAVIQSHGGADPVSEVKTKGPAPQTCAERYTKYIMFNYADLNAK